MERENGISTDRAAGLRPSLSRHWKALFGGEVRRISLDPGFSCPNRVAGGAGGCAFCDPASFSPAYGDKRTVADQLDEGIAKGRARGKTLFAAYFQPRTNTYAPLERLREVWDAAAARPEVVALCVGTRPDCVPDEVLDLLAGYRGRFGEIWLELGLQSSHDATLAALGRGHDAASFAEASRRARARGLKVCAHVILGLPGETAAMEAETADFLAGLGVEGAKLHQLSIVRGTPLAESYLAGKVVCLTEAEYARRVAAFVGRLPDSIVLHRLAGDSLGGVELAPNFNKGRVLSEIAGLLAACGSTPG